MVKEVKMVITLRSGKEVDLLTSKLEHKEERMSKEVKEGSWESRGAQKQGESMVSDLHLKRTAKWPPAKWFRSPRTPFHNAKWLRNSPRLEILYFAAPFRRVFRSCETTLWHTSAILQPRTLISQESNASNGVRIGVETKKLWPFEDDANNESPMIQTAQFRVETKKLWPFEDKPQSQSGNFLISQPPPFRRVFRSCETTLWHMSAT
ncbi:hypothetical protein AAG906_006806 [Vitis piasezkii]